MSKPLHGLILALALGLLTDSRMAMAAAPPEIELLIKQLKDPDETVRLKAAKELGKLKEKAKDAIPALTVATADADEDVRSVAKKALAAIKAAEKVDVEKVDEKLAPLIKDMKASDNAGRLATIAKLEEMGADAKPAGAALVEFGMMSKNVAVKDAANAAFEKIDPLVHKEIITLYYDTDRQKRDGAVMSMSLMAEKAKAAVPIIKAYHLAAMKADKRTPGNTLEALAAIAPEDESVQRMILDLVGGPSSALPGAVYRPSVKGARPIGGGGSRGSVITLMHELKIEDKQKIAPLVSGLAQSQVADRFGTEAKDRELMIAELGKLRVENKEKYPALMTALSKNAKERALIIDELAKLGVDAKAALPTLMALKTDKEEAVRTAATAAIQAIKE